MRIDSDLSDEIAAVMPQTITSRNIHDVNNAVTNSCDLLFHSHMTRHVYVGIVFERLTSKLNPIVQSTRC